MLIYVKSLKKNKKKTFYGRTDRRTTQNYSPEPHNTKKNLVFGYVLRINLIFFSYFKFIIKSITKNYFFYFKLSIFRNLHKISKVPKPRPEPLGFFECIYLTQ